MDYKALLDKIPVLGWIIKQMGQAEVDYGGFLMLTALGMFFYGLTYTDISQAQVFTITLALSPIWITYFIFRHLFYSKWMDKVGKSFSLYNGRTTLRIKLPPEVFRSPEAMEFVLSQIHNVGTPDNLMQTYLQGKRPLNFSLEIASFGGDVRFYANLPTVKTKIAFEANMYAQYPGVEIIEEAVDYAAEIPTGGGDDWEVFSLHMRKKKPQEYPIKTYIEFGLDKMPKEEEKSDPITPMLEIMASIKPTDHLYVQFIITPFRVASFKNGQLVAKEGPSWEVKVQEIIDEMMGRDSKTKKSVEGDVREEIARLTMGERDTITALERNAGKYGYETGIRWLYAHPTGKFDGELINRAIRMFSQWDIIGRQAIGVAWRTDTHYKDLVPGDKKKIAGWKVQEHREFKRRLFYPKSWLANTKIFTAEELASIWHLPGKVAVTPSLGRIESTRAEAPGNLPIAPQ